MLPEKYTESPWDQYFTVKIPEHFTYEFSRTLRSEKTREVYLSCVEKFLKFVQLNFKKLKSPSSLKQLHVMRYMEYLEKHGGPQGDGLAPKSLIQILAAIKKFSMYLVYSGYIHQDLTSLIPRPKDSALRPTECLTAEEVKKLFKALDPNHYSYYLHKALMTLLFGTGMRRNEILHLRFSNYMTTTLDRGDGTSEIHKFFRYKNKGGKFINVRLHPKVVEAIDDYVRWLKIEDYPIHAKRYLFVGTKGKIKEKNAPMSPWTINYMLKSYAQKADIKKRISPHVGKKTAINEAIKRGMGLYEVSQFAQHGSIQTTQKYISEREQQGQYQVSQSLSYFD